MSFDFSNLFGQMMAEQKETKAKKAKASTPVVQQDWIDITNMPEITDESLDAIVCTEVLEHCADLYSAVKEMYRVLKPGGLLLAAAPFVWPDHHTDEYPDFWRITRRKQAKF